MFRFSEPVFRGTSGLSERHGGFGVRYCLASTTAAGADDCISSVSPNSSLLNVVRRRPASSKLLCEPLAEESRGQ